MGELVAIPDLRLVPKEPDEEIVVALRALLERAERGEVRGLAVAADLPDNVYVFHRGASRFTLLGALAYLQHRVADYIQSDGD